MPDKPSRMILMGMDGVMYYHLKKFVDEGKMPNISYLIQDGTLAEACPIPPCDTPTNWTTIATGARTGTHGVTGFRIHLPGESLDVGQRPEHRKRSFESTYCNAEYLWDAADKAGMRCLVINYPVGWPPNFQRGMMINGDGKPRKIAKSIHYIPAATASTAKQPFCAVQFKKTTNRASLRSYSPVLEATIPICSEINVETLCLKILVWDSRKMGYDTIVFSNQTLGVGETSQWLKMSFRVSEKQVRPHPENGIVTGFFKFHLRSLSPDAADFDLFRTPIFITSFWKDIYMQNVYIEGVDPLRAAIRIDNLVKSFEDVIAVNNISLEVWEGELFGLLGPNGAGKTTTINILCGLLEPTGGSASVGGYDTQKETGKVKTLIGVCPQETAVYPHLSGRENIELFGNLHTVPKENLKKRVDELLRRLSLLDDADRRAGKYSGGMMRRVNLAMALIHDPKIAFLDEPTVGMDPQSRRAVWDFIRELKKQGKTVILTTHYMEEAEELCDRVGVIDHGALIALGSPSQLRDKYNAKDLEEVFISLTGRKIREGL